MKLNKNSGLRKAMRALPTLAALAALVSGAACARQGKTLKASQQTIAQAARIQIQKTYGTSSLSDADIAFAAKFEGASLLVTNKTTGEDNMRTIVGDLQLIIKDVEPMTASGTISHVGVNKLELDKNTDKIKVTARCANESCTDVIAEISKLAVAELQAVAPAPIATEASDDAGTSDAAASSVTAPGTEVVAPAPAEQAPAATSTETVAVAKMYLWFKVPRAESKNETLEAKAARQNAFELLYSSPSNSEELSGSIANSVNALKTHGAAVEVQPTAEDSAPAPAEADENVTIESSDDETAAEAAPVVAAPSASPAPTPAPSASPAPTASPAPAPSATPAPTATPAAAVAPSVGPTR